MARQKRESNRDYDDRLRSVREELTTMQVASKDPDEKQEIGAVRKIIDDKIEQRNERREQVRVGAQAVAEVAVVPLRATVVLNHTADTVVEATGMIAVAVYDRLPAPKSNSRHQADTEANSQSPVAEHSTAKAPKDA